MDSKKFEEFLEGVTTAKSEPLAKTAIKSRICWIKRVENDFSISIDDIVANKDKTLDLLVKIRDGGLFTERQRRNFPNAIRYYYEFKNGEKLGTLKQNGR